MIPYKEYKYLYPPRPEHKISSDTIGKYDNGEYIGQPKFNGDCCNLFMNDSGLIKLMGRYTTELTKGKKNEMDLAGAYRGNGFLVLCGELLTKTQTGEDGKPFNQKFVIWDILVHNSMYLIGTTIMERLELLEELYPCNRIQIGSDGIMESYNHICVTGITGIYRSPAYLNGFGKLYKELVKTPLYEGLVLKRKDAPLQYGYNEKNNTTWQIKVRRATKNCAI